MLAHAELDALLRHARGKDITKLMAAFEKVQAHTGAEREAALAELVALVTGNHGLG